MTTTNSGGSAAASSPPRPADDRALGAPVTAARAVTHAPVAKGRLLEEVFDLGSGVQAVVAGSDFTGEGLCFAVSGAGATIDAATGLVSIPTDRALQATVTVTATNQGGSASSIFQVTVEAEDIPFALEAEDVEIVRAVPRPAGQETRLAALRFPGLAGETVHAIEWTTGAWATGKDADARYEAVTRTGPDSYRLLMRDPAPNPPGATPGIDRGGLPLRFRWRRTAEGPWSAPSQTFPVPAPAAGWLPLVARNKAEFEAGEVGGPGLQFLRDFATTPADPDLILAPMDQNFPWASDDFGKSFHTPAWKGLWAGRSGLSAWIDPEDPDRQLLMYTIGGLAGNRNASAAARALSGVYRSLDGGESCEQVLSLPWQFGTQTMRHNFHLLASAPGGTPATRTIYCLQVAGSSRSTDLATIQLWRSTDGGANWSPLGGALAPATYARGESGPWGIAVAPNGDLYQWGGMGAWHSPAGPEIGTAWSRLDTLPAGKPVHQMDASAGEGVVWAIVGDHGLYLAIDGVGFAKNAALGTKDPRTFGISPADRNIIVVQCVGQEAPSWSHDGGATWAEGTTRMALGQEDNFSHRFGSRDHYGLLPKLDDRDTWLAWRNQHLGISRDGGRSWDWTGAFYDGTHTRAIGFHPGDWKTFAQAQQDRALVLTQTAGDYWLSDHIDKGNTYGVQVTTAIANDQHISGSGTVIHASGRIVTLQGHAGGNRVPVIIQAANGHPLGNTLVKGDYVSNLSDYASLDPHDGDSAFMGKYRLEALNAPAMVDVIFTAMTHHFVGASGAGGATTIYGADKKRADKTLYRSTDRGASWTAWHVAAGSFRPVDASPVLAVCPHHPARVYAVSGAGKMVRIEGIAAPEETLVFDARTALGAGLPDYAVNSIAVDPFDEDLLYVSLHMWGVPNVFRSTDRGTTWEDVSRGVPPLDGVLFVHPLTSDVIFGSSHGSHVLPPPEGHRQAYGITGSVYDRVRAFLGWPVVGSMRHWPGVVPTARED